VEFTGKKRMEERKESLEVRRDTNIGAEVERGAENELLIIKSLYSILFHF